MNFKIILIALFLILVDIAVYIILGLLLMNYDDFYDESMGEYWSWNSMSFTDKLTVIGLNFWHLVNILTITYLIYRTYKVIKSKRKNVLKQQL